MIRDLSARPDKVICHPLCVTPKLSKYHSSRTPFADYKIVCPHRRTLQFSRIACTYSSRGCHPSQTAVFHCTHYPRAASSNKPIPMGCIEASIAALITSRSKLLRQMRRTLANNGHVPTVTPAAAARCAAALADGCSCHCESRDYHCEMSSTPVHGQ